MELIHFQPKRERERKHSKKRRKKTEKRGRRKKDQNNKKRELDKNKEQKDFKMETIFMQTTKHVTTIKPSITNHYEDN